MMSQDEKTDAFLPDDPESLKRAEELIQQLDLCYMLYGLMIQGQMPAEEWNRESEAAEAALDAIALKDPELATYIHRKTEYFTSPLPEGYVYIGQRVALSPREKEIYNTPSKRAQYIADLLEGRRLAYPLTPLCQGDRSPRAPATPEDRRQPMQTREA